MNSPQTSPYIDLLIWHQWLYHALIYTLDTYDYTLYWLTHDTRDCILHWFTHLTPMIVSLRSGVYVNVRNLRTFWCNHKLHWVTMCSGYRFGLQYEFQLYEWCAAWMAYKRLMLPLVYSFVTCDGTFWRHWSSRFKFVTPSHHILIITNYGVSKRNFPLHDLRHRLQCHINGIYNYQMSYHHENKVYWNRLLEPMGFSWTEFLYLFIAEMVSSRLLNVFLFLIIQPWGLFTYRY